MPSPQPVRLLIKARWIVPVVPENAVLENCALAVNNGQIVALLPQEEAEKRFHPEQTINLNSHVLIPGLVNAHGHAAMSLLRGYAEDKPVNEWLEQQIWPAERQWVSEEFVRDGTALAIAEMIRSGTTCFGDMYFFPEQAAQVAQQAHVRGQIFFPIFDAASVWGSGPDDYFAKGLSLHDDFRSSSLINIGFGPHAPYSVADDHLKKIAIFAQEMDAPIQIHLHESAQEVADSVTRYGQRPSQRLMELGLLSPLTQCVHVTQVDDVDIALLLQSGAHVIHCPESNMKLASGACPVDRLTRLGVNVALGTDSAASNNDLDMFGEMKSAALLAKLISGDASAVSAHSALRMATLNGAKAMGLEDQIGSLEVGKAADITAVEMSELEAQPLHDPVSQLIYTRSAHRVTHVWVAGKAVLLSRQLQTLNEKELLAKARWWHQKISRQPL